MQKKLSILAVLALLLIGGAVFVWQKNNGQNTPQNQVESIVKVDTIDTSNWKTYRNEQLTFSVKYPEKYTLDNKARDNGFLVSLLDFDETTKDLNGKLIPQYYPVVSIYFWKDINNPDLKMGSWKNEIRYSGISDFLNDSEHTGITKVGERMVAGQKAYILSMPGEIGYEAIMFEGSGGFYRMSFPEVSKKTDDKIKSGILESFKFE